LKCEPSDGIATGTTVPCGGRIRLAAMAVTVAWSVWSGSGPDVS
jgi:hypothetical protein